MSRTDNDTIRRTQEKDKYLPVIYIYFNNQIKKQHVGAE